MYLLSPESLKIIATILSLIASVILALRVSSILSALHFVAKMHDSNINELSKTHGNIVLATGSIEHIERAKGLFLLVLGFSFYGIAALLNLIALIITV